jgi:hypothetical protein
VAVVEELAEIDAEIFSANTDLNYYNETYASMN